MSADYLLHVCNAFQRRHRMSDKQLRIIASRLNPSSSQNGPTKRAGKLYRLGHPRTSRSSLGLRLIRSTPTTRKGACAFQFLVCGFRIVNGLCVTAQAGFGFSAQCKGITGGENLRFWISNQASSKNGPPTIGPGTRGISVFWQLGHSSTFSVVSVTSPMFRIIFL